MKIEIPDFITLELHHLVLDYNGTIAKDGILKSEARALMGQLSSILEIHVITADTFGSVKKELEGLQTTIKVLTTENHTSEKADYINSLGAETCIAVGNGNNDYEMLESAAIGIALLGDEGCSTQTFLASDMVCKNIGDALELLLYPKRLIATMRK